MSYKKPSHPVERRNFSTTLQPRFDRQRGIAIITVLSVLLLMTVLILAFFKMAQSELEDATLYADGVRTTQLTEIVTNMVIGQIREATYSSGANIKDRKTWASQPGAIHRFTAETNRGDNSFANMSDGIFKLYSSSEMFKGYSRGRTLVLDVPGDWDERPAQYVDLNEPVYNTTSDRLFFPIVDPRGYASARDEDIVAGNIEGFHYSDSNSRNRQINGVVEPGVGADQQRVPMPVEWFYMLADGTLGTVNEDGVWQSDPRPTERNPMVARLAFWTDDESSKININTASEGAFWDIPRVDSFAERSYGKHQPARNEVYRYPGHVSGISLSPILFPGSGASNAGASPFLSEKQYKDILALSPKVKYFQEGSGIGNKAATFEPGSHQRQGTLMYAPGTNRLYATIDELLYQGAPADGPGADSREINDIFRSERTRNYFEYGRHSLTVNSNAPEITAHGTPRISLWPMKAVLSDRRSEWNKISPIENPQRVVDHQTYYDRLIAFASTIGDRRYFWQKNGAGSRHGELYNRSGGQNIELLEYMYALGSSPLPGYGGTLFNKYGSGPLQDGTEIMIQIWDYMRNTNLNDPLLDPLDHYNDATPATGGSASARRVGRGQIAGSCLCGGTQPHRDNWHLKLTPYGKGHGRVYTASEFTMVFYCRAHNRDNELLGDPVAAEALSSGEKLIEVAIAIETFCVTHGFTTIQPKSRIVIAGDFDKGDRNGNLDVEYADYPEYKILTLDAEGKPVEKPFPRLVANKDNRPGVVARWDDEENYDGKRGWGAHGGVRLFSADLEGATSANLFEDNKNENTMVFRTNIERVDAQNVILEPEDGDPPNGIVISDQYESMQFLGSSKPLSVVLYDDFREGSSNVFNLIQLFEIKFDNPDAEGEPITIPVPSIDEELEYTWAARLRDASRDSSRLISEDHDVTRSVIVAHSDFRLISGRRATYTAERNRGGDWTVHPDYNTPMKRHAHTLTAADGRKLPGFSSNRGYALNQSGSPLSYPDGLAPDFVGDPTSDRFFPRSRPFGSDDYELSVDPGITGDWDQGIGAHIDGPYINRPDDGTSFAGSTDGNGDPYFEGLGDTGDKVDRTFFSPNRVVASAGQLGSIPTGMQAGVPWRTLLFRPDPEHFGARAYPSNTSPPDHSIMDFFWMPIVEPFPISQPFATMGKVNMNYQMVPFDYIKRKTAVHAVMKDQRMLAVENGSINSYKTKSGKDHRFPINIPVTLLQFEDRFANGEVFRAASEICEIYMVPQGATGAPSGRNTLGTPQRGTIGSKGLDYPPMRTFWKGHALTGDNSKERTYTNLYPRLTTKSNVFQTHMIVETLQKSRSVEHDVFDPGEDRVIGRWRGSAVIERNIDPELIKPGSGVPDYTQAKQRQLHVMESMERLYAYRVLNVKQFNP